MTTGQRILRTQSTIVPVNTCRPNIVRRPVLYLLPRGGPLLAPTVQTLISMIAVTLPAAIPVNGCETLRGKHLVLAFSVTGSIDMNGIKVKVRVDCGRVTYVPVNDAALALLEISGASELSDRVLILAQTRLGLPVDMGYPTACNVIDFKLAQARKFQAG